MEIRKFIATTIREYLNESKTYSFNLNVKEKTDNGFTYKIFYYSFNSLFSNASLIFTVKYL
jgi:hypothetical protein